METVRVDVPDEVIATIDGLNDVVGPVGVTDADRLIVPLNPFTLVRVTVDVPDEPCRILSEVGFSEREKSGGGGA